MTSGDLAPVVEDMSTYLICGRMLSKPPKDPRTGRSVAQGIEDARLAERLGFRRAFLSARLDIKDAGALLGGAAAASSRLEVGTGALAVPSRDPRVTASLGATMHAAYGPRFILGLGRTEPQFMSYGQVTYQHLAEFKDAGADELALYGSTPEQNAGLIEKWRDQHSQQAKGTSP